MVAPPSVSTPDLVRALAIAGVPAADLGLSETLGQGIKVDLTGNQAPIDSSQIANRYQTVTNSAGAQTAPAAGASLASLATVSYAYYRADVYVGFGGTAEATTQDNFILKDGSTTIATIPVANVANTLAPVQTLYVNSANGTLSINVGGTAGSAGSVYKATLRLTRLV